MTINTETINNECCPQFHVEKWDGKLLEWKEKPFIKESVPAIFHIPFKRMLGKKITGMMKQVEDSGKMDENNEDILLLFTDPHPFKSDLYLSVTDAVPKAKNIALSGTFMTKVFDGPYKAIPKFMKQMDGYLRSKNKRADTYFVHYAYCPKCSEERGHNYMVLFAKV